MLEEPDWMLSQAKTRSQFEKRGFDESQVDHDGRASLLLTMCLTIFDLGRFCCHCQ